ncbi:hypothetical protein GGX14DRAFT_594613 [Mycena pura]|uniref:Uncharacterized protein n=1 Tax=Mycena pura TaxID=153505 RepID=A0AAD6UQR8_9AGAR|nr:hypothetical protein GGX14DRAFT_594613 [Mycena pura]
MENTIVLHRQSDPTWLRAGIRMWNRCRHQLETSRSPAGFQRREGMGPPWIQFSWQPAGEPDGRHIDRKVVGRIAVCPHRRRHVHRHRIDDAVDLRLNWIVGGLRDCRLVVAVQIAVVLQDGPERTEGQRRPQASKCADASERADERGASERTDERGPRASECTDKRGASERADGQVDEAAERGQGGTRASGRAAQATRVGEQRVLKQICFDEWCKDNNSLIVVFHSNNVGKLRHRRFGLFREDFEHEKLVISLFKRRHSTTFYGDPLAAVREAAKHLAVKLEASCICAWEKIAGNHMDTGWYQLANWLIPAEVASWLVPDGSLAV